jgi:uncharacterized protein (DUF58 family)
VYRFLPLLALLIFVAAILRDDFALTLVYLFVGATVAGAWWSRKSLAQIRPERKISTHAFLGEKVPVRLKFLNQGWLPVLWLSIQDELPVGLSSMPSFSRITGLKPGAAVQFDYTLDARKRGFYTIGPLVLSTGDILGLQNQEQRQAPADFLTIYPKIIPLTSVKLPSRSPQGTLRHTQPIFEDPTRILNKRDYTAGDSLRQVDWKSSAATGRLQVKQFEASIALEAFIFLDLNSDNYPRRGRIDSGELAIVIAASLAAWISSKRQTVGLQVNGKDSLTNTNPPTLPPNKGQAHLMHVLEILARVEMSLSDSLSRVIQQQRTRLPWGATLIVITGQSDAFLLDELYQARRNGQETLLILAGTANFNPEMTRRAAFFGIPLITIANEHDLDIWRK